MSTKEVTLKFPYRSTLKDPVELNHNINYYLLTNSKLYLKDNYVFYNGFDGLSIRKQFTADQTLEAYSFNDIEIKWADVLHRKYDNITLNVPVQFLNDETSGKAKEKQNFAKTLIYNIDEFKKVYKETVLNHLLNPENLEKYIENGFDHIIPTNQDTESEFLNGVSIVAQFPAMIMQKAGVEFIIVEKSDGELFTF